MAQTGYTPILIYSSSTASNTPAVGNLTNSTLGSELAINITDGKLFYKDNANAIQVIGWKTTPATAGGTGQTSYAVGDILYANTTTTLAKLADVATGNALISGGVGVAPAWGKIGLTTHVSGVLPTANGGTNLSSFTANGVVYASSTSALATGSTLTFDGTTLNSAKLGLTSTSAGALVDLATLTNSSNTTNTETGIFFAPTTAAGNIRGARISAYQVTGNNDIALKFYPGNGATIAVAQTIWPTGGVSIGNTTDPGVGSLSVNGNVVIATSGKGIDFSATPGTGTSELLADYEEGTWTPTDGSGAGLSLSASGAYTKIGRMVYWQAIVVYPVTANASSASIAGLPFALNLVSNVAGRSGSTITATDETTLVQSLQIETSNSVRFYKAGFVQNTNLELSGNQIYCAGFYST